ncbi:DUF2272 domain-containing protein [Pseudorhodoferax sp. Leaf267]|uniref:DUF2272 domain-containing protein n=1 Tax=Pseudorhodoferax sp. Leaf267 TaxID=1736316 RepID=UPI0006FC73DA|nr:DUF2272 domain-containing protein [Pseudorhodoferax sp. Leaf267]KQP22004.1 hypothetical protein ASF43_24455 [Pseudorhodoferax sp. Leaf267]
MARPLLLCALMLCGAAGAQAAGLCQATADVPPPPRALAMAQAAEREHLAWGQQTLDAHGRLTQAGAYEAEDSPRGLFTPPPWQRVMGYWQAVDPAQRLPSLVRFGALWPADRGLLLQAVELASAARLHGLGAGHDQGLTSAEQSAIAAALDRVAVVDTPWSAAFVSWLAREAGLATHEFTFSEAHADYAAAAWTAGQQEAAGTATPYALRACDLLRTPPRVGDLVCQARGRAAGLDSFEALGAQLAERNVGIGESLPMHCDVVVQVDAGGFEAVGGNVLQSVTRRRLDFAPGTRLLDPSYLPSAPAGIERHMSRQPWSLLLQWR